MDTTKTRRKVLLINRKFQIKYLLQTILLSLSVITIFFFVIRLNIASFRSSAISSGLNPDHIIFETLNRLQASLDVYFIFGSIMVIIVVLGFGLFMSNQVAGPVHHIVTHLRKIRSGETAPSEIKFRKNDFFQELADEINKSIETKELRTKAE